MLLSDPTISRKHLGIDPGPDGVVLRDLGSTNGSFVQGSRFNELTLGFGTEVTIGKTVLKYVPTRRRSTCRPPTQESYGSLVGRDPKLRQLFRLLDDVAATDATVLIEGETGTGKELFAEEIHRHSPRKDGPFVVFDCGAVPDELIESALFGHVRGAFTGAVTDRRGRLRGGRRRHAVPRRDRRAGAGGAAGAAARAGQAGRCGPSAAPTTRAPRCASSRPPTATCAPRSRPSRFARISTTASRSCACSVPPLRERPDDIPLLVQHFMRQFRGERPLAGRARGPGAPAPAHWPGNVRELRNVDRARLRASATAIGWSSTTRSTSGRAGERHAPAPSTSTCPSRRRRRRSSTASSASTSQALLKRHEGNLSAAARAAEIDRKHLRELLRKHGLRESGDS